MIITEKQFQHIMRELRVGKILQMDDEGRQTLLNDAADIIDYLRQRVKRLEAEKRGV